jgi:predicted nucleic acid-binding protein
VDFISLEQLPLRAAIDTGVVLRGFWPSEPSFAADPRTPMCRAFVTSMLAAGRQLVVSAVSIAEALRFSNQRVVPRHRGIEVVAFDDQAARILGEYFRDEALKQVQQEVGTARRVVSIDALIVASAIRYRAEVIVAIDGDIPALVAKANVEFRVITAQTPADFQVRQTDLGL